MANMITIFCFAFIKSAADAHRIIRETYKCYSH